jgi:hypothetical protein
LRSGLLGAFRPADVDPAWSDVRSLGCQVRVAVNGAGSYSVFHSDGVQAFRPARHGGPEGPHYTNSENALVAAVVDRLRVAV